MKENESVISIDHAYRTYVNGVLLEPGESVNVSSDKPVNIQTFGGGGCLVRTFALSRVVVELTMSNVLNFKKPDRPNVWQCVCGSQLWFLGQDSRCICSFCSCESYITSTPDGSQLLTHDMYVAGGLAQIKR